MPDLLIAARAIHVGASLSLFGLLLFRLAVLPAALGWAPPAEAARLQRRLDRLALGSVAVALAAAAVWLYAEAAAMSGAGSLGEAASAVSPALLRTRFGHVLMLRVALLLLAGAAAWPGAATRRRLGFGVGAAGAALVLLAATGHAAAMGGAEGAVLLLMQALHLLAAGAWLGALAPLALTLALPSRAAAVAASRFSTLGVAAVTILVVSACYSAAGLIGGPTGFLGTLYGRLALAKILLLVLMLCLAAANRFRYTPALFGADGAHAAAALRRSIVVETALGMFVVAVAATLANTPPAIHEQPWWPLPFRFGADALAEPELRDEVLLAAAMTIAAGGLAWLAVRRRSWLAGAAALALFGWFAPSFALLTVEAYPTSFFRSPTNFAARSIARGADLFAANCAACHGPGGRGDGPARAGLPTAPADLTAEHIWEHSDGDLFWWISHGIGTAMPGFADRLDGPAIWALIDFVHANALGVEADKNGGRWPRRAVAPAFEATCPNGPVGLHDLGGRVVRVVLSDEAGPDAAQLADRLREAGALTVEAGAAAAPGACATQDPAVRRAYALVADIAPSTAGGEILIDPAGWLRERWVPGERPDWRDPDVLLSRIATIEATPLGAAPVAHHVH